MMEQNSLFFNGTKGKNRIFRMPETLVFSAFIICAITITIFHEPWFDEAQAWQIARYSSWKEILFTVGHYEGHPFLWYFILAVPAKLGVPFEWGLKSIGVIITAVSAYLVIFKAPFPRLIRCVIPFTYFFFYQYGVIVRPYGLQLLLFLLCAMAFRTKDSHPWHMIIPLLLQCFLDAFGMVLAGGITICWVMDIVSEYKKSDIDWKTAVKDKRFLPLCVLLCGAIFVLLLIFPYADTYSAATDATNSVISCLLVAFFTFLSNAFLFTCPFFSSDTNVLQVADFEYGSVLIAGLIGFYLMAAIVCYSSKKELKYFLVPYILFTVFSAVVYFGVHHIGILAIYILFWCWINAEDENRFETGKLLLYKLHATGKNIKAVKIAGIVILVACALMGLVWSAGSCVMEIRYQYSFARETSSFLKESGLDGLKVASVWTESDLSDGEEQSIENINTVLTGIPPQILAYYDTNFIYTFNNGENKGYTTYKKPNVQVNEQNLALWREKGIPDVLIGNVDVELLTDGTVTLADYAPVYELQVYYIFKAKASTLAEPAYVYLRRDLLETYGLTELESEYYSSQVSKGSSE